MREQREFRAHYAEFQAAGIEVAGVSLDSIERSRESSARLRLPYPLLSDTDRHAGEAFGVIRRVGVGAWSLEWFRRITLLVDKDGIVRAIWESIKPRGHAQEVLAVTAALPAASSVARPTRPEPG